MKPVRGGMLAALLLVVTIAGRADEAGPRAGYGGTGERPAQASEAFERGVRAMHEGDARLAEVQFRAVLLLAPHLPEAWANLGYALLAQQHHRAALDAFQRCIALRPAQANAYYGLGVVADALGDRATALGAMRSFVHLAPADDPFVRRARAALWEWQTDATAPVAAGAASPTAQGQQ